MTVTEAAAHLGISRALAYDLVRRRELPAIHLGRRIIVPRHAIDAMLEAWNDDEAS
jgi:excisionase family DNA binding protein